MSTAKRSRLRQSDGRNNSPPPASKRLKTTKSSHVPSKSNLDFLVDADARSNKKLTAKLTNGLTNSRSTRVDESHAVVAANAVDGEDAREKKPAEVIDISSGEEESDGDDDDIPAAATVSKQPALNGHITPDEDADGVAMEGVVVTKAQEQDVEAGAAAKEEGEASFGDMLRARHPEIIDVQASFADPSTERSALIPSDGYRGLTAPSGTSLGTVLTQALKTNDRDLLESCFQVTDMRSVRATIERLASPLVVPLLQKLAERIHKRPGRTQNLMAWVQWSLVVHGGYLAGQPDLMKRLRSLSQVVHERASGLQSLLHLKGKLDLLWAQLDLQKRQRKDARTSSSDEEGDSHVIYIDGAHNELWSDEEELNAARKVENNSNAPKVQARTPQSDLSESGDESESDEDMPNGLAQESDDEGEDAEEDDGLIDVEAEETDNDDGEDDEEEEDSEEDVSESEDEEDDQDDEEGEMMVKPPKPATLNRKR